MLELSSDLDSRKDGINELIRSQPADDEIEKIPFGKSFLRNEEKTKTQKTSGADSRREAGLKPISGT